jgi:FkbM family methyltransferase
MRFEIRTKIKSLLPRKPSLEVFEPYIKDLPIKGCPCRFFYGTPQAKEWYDPLKPYAKAEYDWVVENIDLKNQKIIDGGAHHGQYSVVFAVGSGHTSEVISVDPVSSNCALIEVNMALNRAKAKIEQCAISDSDGNVLFSFESNGRIVSKSGQLKPSKRLPTIMKDATIVKLDVEGAEFIILPDQIDEMPRVHTWIVEIHPSDSRNPLLLVDLFRRKDFELLWVNRDRTLVEPYPDSASWKSHTTVFALRK